MMRRISRLDYPPCGDEVASKKGHSGPCLGAILDPAGEAVANSLRWGWGRRIATNKWLLESLAREIR